MRPCASPEVYSPMTKELTEKSKRWTNAKEPLPCNVAGDEGGMWRVLCHGEEGVTFLLEVLGWASGTATFQLPLDINLSYKDGREVHLRNRK